MDFTQDFNKGNYQIRSYEPGKVVINDTTYTESVVVSMSQLILWRPQKLTELQSEDLAVIINLEPAIIILGTGEKQIFPTAEQLKLLAEKNIGIEIMNTGAACRTFNVLASEGRNVAAALLL